MKFQLQMKITIVLIISLICITSLFAQDSGMNIYVLHFTDKGLDKNAILNPSNYLSAKANERRFKQNISFDQADIPVNKKYLDAVSNTGARILARSRWFNTLVVEANAVMINKISAFPYVSDIQPLGINSQKQSLPLTPEKLTLENESLTRLLKETTKNRTTDLYNYGAAYNQINQLKGQYLHNLGYSGQGMTIAVIDAGFNSVDIMACFDSLRANNQIKGTRDFAQPGNNVYATSMNSHGTSVLSCMGAYSSGELVGTAPKADYWLLRSEVAATESIIEEYYWVSAAEFADSVGADMINSSLGYTVFPDSPESNHTYADLDGNTTIVTKGADKAAEKGILVVNSAGNEGSKEWKFIGAPADGDSVFTIGAVDSVGNRVAFSSVGYTFDRRIKPTVAAQGYHAAVFAPGGLSVKANGTSFSSPIVCGITACLWQAFPDLNNMQIIEFIKSSASQFNQPDSLLGWGIPDLQKASSTLFIEALAQETTLVAFPNPVYNYLTLEFQDSFYGKVNVEIVNLQGKTVYTNQCFEGPDRSIQLNDIGNLASGFYLIKVSDSSRNFVGKIIKM